MRAETLILELMADTSQLTRDINAAIDNAAKKVKGLESNSLIVKAPLDNLIKLNQELDKKQAHILETVKLARDNPIVMRADTRQLKEARQEMSKTASASQQTKTKVREQTVTPSTNGKPLEEIQRQYKKTSQSHVRTKIDLMNQVITTSVNPTQLIGLQNEYGKVIDKHFKVKGTLSRDGLKVKADITDVEKLIKEMSGVASKELTTQISLKTKADVSGRKEKKEDNLKTAVMVELLGQILDYTRENLQNNKESLLDKVTYVPRTLARSSLEGMGYAYGGMSFSNSLREFEKQTGLKIGDKLGGFYGKYAGKAVKSGMDTYSVYSQTDAVTTGVSDFNDSVKKANDEVENLQRSIANAFSEPVENNIQDAAIQLLKTLEAIANVPSVPLDTLVKAQKELNVDTNLEEALQNSEEYKKEFQKRPDISKAKRVFIVSGGFAGTGGKSSLEVADKLGAHLQDGDVIIPVENYHNDVTRPIVENPAQWVGDAAVITSRLGLTGVNKDAARMTGAAIAVQELNPDAQIKFVGYSGGGFNAEDAVRQSNLIGLQNVSGIALATPGLMGKSSLPNFTGYMGEHDPIRYGEQAFRGIGIARPNASIEGINSHDWDAYLKNASVLSLIFDDIIQQMSNMSGTQDDFPFSIADIQLKVRELDILNESLRRIVAESVAFEQNIPSVIPLGLPPVTEKIAVPVIEPPVVESKKAEATKAVSEVTKKAVERSVIKEKDPANIDQSLKQSVMADLSRVRRNASSDITQDAAQERFKYIKDKFTKANAKVTKAIKEGNYEFAKAQAESIVYVSEKATNEINEILASLKEHGADTSITAEGVGGDLQRLKGQISKARNNADKQIKKIYKQQAKAAQDLRKSVEQLPPVVTPELKPSVFVDPKASRDYLMGRKKELISEGLNEKEVGSAFGKVIYRIKKLEGVDLNSIGQDTIEGLRKGLLNKEGELDATILKIAEGLPLEVKKALGIASPSKVMAEIGRWTLKGLSNGLMVDAKTVIANAKRIGNQVGDGVGKGIESALEIHSPSERAKRIMKNVGLGLIGGASYLYEATRKVASKVNSFAGEMEDKGAGIVHQAIADKIVAFTESRIDDLIDFIEKARSGVVSLTKNNASLNPDVQDVIARVQKSSTPAKMALDDLKKSLKGLNKEFNDLIESKPSLKAVWGVLEQVKEGLIGYIGLSVLSSLFSDFAKSSYESARNMERFKSSLSFANNQNPTKTLREIFDFSQKIGGNFKTAEDSYRRLITASYLNPIQSQVMPIFKGVESLGASVSLTPEQQQNVYLALSQVIGKNRLQAEELQGQIAEALPQAPGIIARSLGKTELELRKMMQTGSLSAMEVLPKFGTQAEIESQIPLLKSSQGINAEITRLNNNIERLRQNTGEILTGASLNPLKSLNAVLSLLNGQGKVLIYTVGLLTVILGVKLTAAFIQVAGATRIGSLALSVFGNTIKGVATQMAPVFMLTLAFQGLFKVIDAGNRDLKLMVNQTKDAVNAVKNLKYQGTQNKPFSFVESGREIVAGLGPDKLFDLPQRIITTDKSGKRTAHKMTLAEDIGRRRDISNIDSLIERTKELNQIRPAVFNDVNKLGQVAAQIKQLDYDIILKQTEISNASQMGDVNQITRLNKELGLLSAKRNDYVKEQLGATGLYQNQLQRLEAAKEITQTLVMDEADRERRINDINEQIAETNSLLKASQAAMNVIDKNYVSNENTLKKISLLLNDINYKSELMGQIQQKNIKQLRLNNQLDDIQLQRITGEKQIDVAISLLFDKKTIQKDLTNILNAFDEAIKNSLLTLPEFQKSGKKYKSIQEALMDSSPESIDAILQNREDLHSSQRQLLTTAKTLLEVNRDIVGIEGNIVELKKQQKDFENQRFQSELEYNRMLTTNNRSISTISLLINRRQSQAQNQLQQTKDEIAKIQQEIKDTSLLLSKKIGDPTELRKTISNLRVQLANQQLLLVQNYDAVLDFNRNLSYSIRDFNRGIESKNSEIRGIYRDWQRTLDDTVYDNQLTVRRLGEAYQDLMFNMESQLETSRNELLNLTDQINSEKRKQASLSITPGIDSYAKQLDGIFSQLFDSLTNGESEKRQANLEAVQTQKQYIDSLRQIRDIQEQEYQARKDQIRKIEDLNGQYSQLIRQVQDMYIKGNQERDDFIRTNKREGYDVTKQLAPAPNFANNQRSQAGTVQPMIIYQNGQTIRNLPAQNPVNNVVPFPSNSRPTIQNQAPVKPIDLGNIDSTNNDWQSYYWQQKIKEQLPPVPKVNQAIASNLNNQLQQRAKELQSLAKPSVIPTVSASIPKKVQFGRASISHEELIALQQTAMRLGMPLATLLTIMLFETKGTLNPSIQNSKGATGLIQFMPATAKRLGTTINALKKMSFQEQLPYVEKYFKLHGWQAGMSDLEAYATVLGGNPRNINSKDSNGTNALSGMQRMNRQHRPIADNIMQHFGILSASPAFNFGIPESLEVGKTAGLLDDLGGFVSDKLNQFGNWKVNHRWMGKPKKQWDLYEVMRDYVINQGAENNIEGEVKDLHKQTSSMTKNFVNYLKLQVKQGQIDAKTVDAYIKQYEGLNKEVTQKVDKAKPKAQPKINRPLKAAEYLNVFFHAHGLDWNLINEGMVDALAKGQVGKKFKMPKGFPLQQQHFENYLKLPETEQARLLLEAQAKRRGKIDDPILVRERTAKTSPTATAPIIKQNESVTAIKEGVKEALSPAPMAIASITAQNFTPEKIVEFNPNLPKVPKLQEIPLSDYDALKERADAQKSVNESITNQKLILAQTKQDTAYLQAINDLQKMIYSLQDANRNKLRGAYDMRLEIASLVSNAKGYLTAAEQNFKVGSDMFRQIEDKRRQLADMRLDESRKQADWDKEKAILVERIESNDQLTLDQKQQAIQRIANLDTLIKESQELQKHHDIQLDILNADNNRMIQLARIKDAEIQRNNAIKEYADITASLATARYNLGGELINNGTVISAKMNALVNAYEFKEKLKTLNLSTAQMDEMVKMQKELSDINIAQSYVDAIPFLKEFSTGLKDAILQTTTWNDALKKLLDLVAGTILDQMVIKPIQLGIANILNDWGIFGNTEPINPPALDTNSGFSQAPFNEFGAVDYSGIVSGSQALAQSIQSVNTVIPDLGTAFVEQTLTTTQNTITEQTALATFVSALTQASAAVLGFSASLGGRMFGAFNPVSESLLSGFTGDTLMLPTFANGVDNAMKKERNLSGKSPFLAVLHEGEAVLSTLNGDAQLWRALKANGDWNHLKADNPKNFAFGSEVKPVRTTTIKSGDNVQISMVVNASNADSFRKSERRILSDMEAQIKRNRR